MGPYTQFLPSALQASASLRLPHDAVLAPTAATTNEALRQRLSLLSSQLRHREVEIDSLKADVRRWRAAVTARGHRIAAG